MKRILLVFFVSTAMLCAAVILACDLCVPQGQLDPQGGGPYSSAICWTTTDGSGPYSWCVGGDSYCSYYGSDGSCPVQGGSCTDPGGCIQNPQSVVVQHPRCDIDVSGRCGTQSMLSAGFLN